MKNFLGNKFLLLIAFAFLVLAGCTGGGGDTQTATNSAKALTAFSLAGVTGTIDETNKTIAVTMPFGTNVTALVATFTTTGTAVSIGATSQISGTTANNFTSPIVYTVTAADATTASYTVTATVGPGFLYIGYPNFLVRANPATGAIVNQFANLSGATSMTFGTDGFLYIGYPNFLVRANPATGAIVNQFANLSGATSMTFGTE